MTRYLLDTGIASDFINRRLELFDRVTAADLLRVARHYLAPTRRRTLLTLPPIQEKAA